MKDFDISELSKITFVSIKNEVKIENIEIKKIYIIQ